MIEINQSFAAQAHAISRELASDPDRANPNGEWLGLITLCIGGGQGIALAIERL